MGRQRGETWRTTPSAPRATTAPSSRVGQVGAGDVWTRVGVHRGATNGRDAPKIKEVSRRTLVSLPHSILRHVGVVPRVLSFRGRRRLGPASTVGPRNPTNLRSTCLSEVDSLKGSQTGAPARKPPVRYPRPRRTRTSEQGTPGRHTGLLLRT